MLLYRSQQQHMTSAKIDHNFTFTVRNTVYTTLHTGVCMCVVYNVADSNSYHYATVLCMHAVVRGVY